MSAPGSSSTALASNRRSTSASSAWTPATSGGGAGPGARGTGFRAAGFMGRVELGSSRASQVAAGRSYQGVAGSPCSAGRRNGASWVVGAAAAAAAEAAAEADAEAGGRGARCCCCWRSAARRGPWSATDRSRASTVSAR